MSQLVTELSRLWSGSAEPPDLVSWWVSVSTATAPNPPSPHELLQALTLDQERRWQSGAPWLVEDYITRLPSLPAGIPWTLELAISEARTLATLNHPNILPVDDIGHDTSGVLQDGAIFVVSQFISGGTLDRTWYPTAARTDLPASGSLPELLSTIRRNPGRSGNRARPGPAAVPRESTATSHQVRRRSSAVHRPRDSCPAGGWSGNLRASGHSG